MIFHHCRIALPWVSQKEAQICLAALFKAAWAYFWFTLFLVGTYHLKPWLFMHITNIFNEVFVSLFYPIINIRIFVSIRNKNLCILPAKLTVEQLLDNYTREESVCMSIIFMSFILLQVYYIVSNYYILNSMKTGHGIIGIPTC